MSRSSETYFQILLKNVKPSDEEFVTSDCFDFGALGVSEDLDFKQTSLKYEPETLEKEVLDLQVYFSEAPSTEFLKRIHSTYPGVQVESLEKENKDWLSEWKKGFLEFELVSGIWVVPSWREPPPHARQLIRIDPGMAFGTGTHETTQLAAQGIFDCFQGSSPPKSAIDVGSGTGILAILCGLLNAEKVHATEIDKLAQEVGRKNIAESQLSGVLMLEDQIDHIFEDYDLVIANIIDGVLLDIQQDLKKCLHSQSQLIVTGILTEREENFVKNFELPSHFSWKHRLEKGEWVGLVGGPQ